MESLILKAQDFTESRDDRLRRIPWWDADRIKAARVMVVGAGALGNEIVKNLALLGIGKIIVIDKDAVELSNLSRSVLFRESDIGRPKAEVVAERARDLNPDITIAGWHRDILHDVGLGVFRQMDVVLGGLDNREARLAINQSCWRVNVPWIDGAIEVLHGIARVFQPPDGPCYECTLNRKDFELLARRKSCALLTREEIRSGRVPTTPTMASIVGGIQVQEAVKLLHSHRQLPTLAGKGVFFNGLSHDTYVIHYDRKEDCVSHDSYEHIDRLTESHRTLRLGDALALCRNQLGPEASLRFARELLVEWFCRSCEARSVVYKTLSNLRHGQAMCPRCGAAREPRLTHEYTGDPQWANLTLAEIGIPDQDIIEASCGLVRHHFELAPSSGGHC
ncbi:MAG: ThiF family adenylyltransferase [Planctomycetes bacterium]|nr:ThiF family adenylyltransferase [Planctomycetota bacterium]